MRKLNKIRAKIAKTVRELQTAGGLPVAKHALLTSELNKLRKEEQIIVENLDLDED